MTGQPHRMGIDIGSTTAKVAIINQAGTVLYSAYRRHNAETLVTLQTLLQEAHRALGPVHVSLMITGSAGLGVSEKFQLPFIQEVVASAEVVRQCYPSVRTLVDIGGEDAKMIFFAADGRPDIRMNGACAGGTGAFIDQMATLLNVPVADLNSLAAGHTSIYPIASRCGVFAKTDVQNLLSREIPREDIAASIFHAVVLQTLATLARGYEPAPAILFSGGPFTFLPELKNQFLQVLAIEPDGVIHAESPELVPALGAALAGGAQRQELSLVRLIELLAAGAQDGHKVEGRLPNLFLDRQEFADWSSARAQYKVPRISADQVAGQPCFLGIDSGSTTTKLVLIDEQGRVAFDHYRNNHGNALKAVLEGLETIRDQFCTGKAPPQIVRSVVTGYGEDLIRTAFGCDEGMVETLAHFRAARAFDPHVSFILDIGGQDMKAIFVQDGHIQNIEINEACSSGCGSFIESFARSMGHGVADFAQKACTSAGPCDLGTRCTVFMNSKVKQALREGAGVDDIAAGLAYSVIKNAIHKVLKITDTRVLGDHIIVQGGTFRNPAVHKALERLLDKKVLCPDIAELMGAYGAALTARDAYQAGATSAGHFVGLDALAKGADYQRKHIQCRGCENQCTVTKLVFPNGNAFYTGNRCERIFTNSGRQDRQGANLFARKYQILFDRETTPTGPPLLTVGIPRVLNLYENYPFWHALFVESGIQVRLSAPSSKALYNQGTGTIMSENICFPAKLVHGHILELIEAGVDRIFFPMVSFEQEEFADAVNCYNCPIVTGYPDVIRSAIDPEGRHGIPLDRLPITFQDEGLLRAACRDYLVALGVDRKIAERAFVCALAAQHTYKEEVRAMAADVLAQTEAGRPAVVLVGRPYHLDPLVNHKVPEILADFGIDVVPEDAVPLLPGQTLDNHHVLTQWEYHNRDYHAARWVAQHEHVELVQLNSFGCGPDAIAVDEVKSILGEHGKRHTVIRVDEIESTGSVKLRLRSLIESLNGHDADPDRPTTPRKQVRAFRQHDRPKTIVVPQFSHFTTAPFTRPLQDFGYRVEILPPASRRSVETGLRYTNNEICYPAVIVVGDLIEALQSGRYDLSNVAIGISQTGGQCRASCYLSLIKRALISAGLEQIPVVSVSASARSLNEQPGFQLDMKRYTYKAALGILYTDGLSTMYHAVASREVHRGQALAVADRYLAYLEDGTLALSKRAVLDMLGRAVADFNAVPTRDRTYPAIGVVGEIYVRYNSFSNHQVVQWLMDQGMEVVVPPLMEFFLSWLVGIKVDVDHRLKRRNLRWLLAMTLKGFVEGIVQEFDAVLSGHRYYRPSHSIWHLAGLAEQIVSLTNQYGEGWLLPGEISALAEDGVPNVLCLEPFGCLPNQVVARGVEKRLKETYPDLNLLFLDTDPGMSEVNYFNRLHFFVDHARTTVESKQSGTDAGRVRPVIAGERRAEPAIVGDD